MATLLFANLDTLRLALASRVVSADVAAGPVYAGIDELGRLWLRPVAPLARETAAGLTRLGVPVLGDAADVELSPRSCWLELVAPLPAAGPPRLPVLIVLPRRRLAAVVAEVRRLQPDAMLAYGSGAMGEAMVKVAPCPMFTLLRELRIFAEQAPGVWVRAGYRHPLADLVAPPAGRLALVDADGSWSWRPDGPFAPEPDAFALPAARIIADAPRPLPPIALPLRLADGGSNEPAELWIIHERPLEQLAELARECGPTLLERFRLAVVEPGGRTIVLLWAKPARGGPPHLPASGLGCRPYLNLPDLFVPCGLRLNPPLRRDVVRRLLGADDGSLTVVLPSGGGEFVPLRVRESAFRPLERAFDFIAEAPARPARGVAFHHGLDWESFRVAEPPPRPRPETPAPPPEPPQAAPPPRPGVVQRIRGLLRPRRKRRWRAGRDEAVADSALSRALPDDLVPPPADTGVRRSDLMERRTTLEGQFLAAAQPDQRLALLPELASLNAQLGAFTDAAACWLSALWQHDAPPKYWLWGWLQVEKKLSRVLFGENDLPLLLEATPSPSTIRTLAACVVWLTAGEPPAELIEHAGRVAHLLETHEEWLPLRAAWLARLRLAHLTGRDTLALARTRDRLLERLYRQGLSAELDVPSFLRFAGRGAGERFQSQRDWLPKLRDSAHRWLDTLARQRPPGYCHPDAGDYPDRDGSATRALADLTLAWGLARLGQETAARHLARAGRAALPPSDPVYDFLARAFDFRLNQALDGRLARGPLPADLLADLDRVGADGDERTLLARYRIDSLRQASRVLEPTEPVHAYRGPAPLPYQNEWTQALAHLPADATPAQVGQRIERGLSAAAVGLESALVLSAGLDLAGRFGPTFARELLDRIGPVLDRLSDPLTHLLLVGKAIDTAALFDRPEGAAPLAERLTKLLSAAAFRLAPLAQRLRRPAAADPHHGPEDLRRLEALPGRAVKLLRRLGLTAEADRLHDRALDWVLQGETPGQLRRTRPEAWLPALRALLHLAGGWFRDGPDGRAEEVLNSARKSLLFGDLPAVEKGPLACAYAAALGEAPARLAQGRIEELFRDLGGLYETRQTNTHYALPPLRLIDAVVQAVAGEESAPGEAVRRWLDEDEYLLRRRMQHDLRAMLDDAQP